MWHYQLQHILRNLACKDRANRIPFKDCIGFHDCPFWKVWDLVTCIRNIYIADKFSGYLLAGFFLLFPIFFITNCFIEWFSFRIVTFWIQKTLVWISQKE